MRKISEQKPQVLRKKLSTDDGQVSEVRADLCAEETATKSRFTCGKHRLCEFLHYPMQSTGTGIRKTYYLTGQRMDGDD